jgi:hypothetical protein
VFVGAAVSGLRSLPAAEKFTIERIQMADGRVEPVLINHEPGAGEPVRWEANPPASCCMTLTEDYALVIFSKGIGAGRYALILAGLTTIGTQAAAEFVTQPTQTAELAARLRERPGRHLPYFEAVVRVRIRGGAPIQTDLVAVHRRNGT